MKQLRGIIIRVVVFLVLFFIAYNILKNVMNRGNTDLTADMSSASLPIVYMNVNDVKLNALHGYTERMEGNYLRGEITPINADRTLKITVDTYGTSIAKVGYEIRNLEGSRLIEDYELESFEFNDNIISASFSFKDLIDDDKEYMLIIKLINGNGDTYYYYTRIINTTELSLMDKLNFCLEFSEKTFDQGKAPELKKYMESNASGDNSSYGYVNIHSSYNQLSWGNLHPELIGEKNINLIYIDSLNACIKLLYRVQIKDEIYNVSEYFRVRKGNERMYLMDYERKMNQIITNEDGLIINGKIINGIVNEPVQMVESPDNGVVAFVQQNSLYSLNTQTGALARIFSFRDAENDDLRTNYDASDIKIMSLDEVGNVSFIVYGYMNRGRHEGQVGVALYQYDPVVNTIEERIFIPYKKSYETLKRDIEKLSYINARSRMYLLIDGTVYSINLESNETEIIASDLDENRFVSSAKNNIIAWQIGNSIEDYTSIQFYSLDSLSPEILYSRAGSIIVPLGFIGEDLIYGTARTSDITINSTGRTLIPMHKITIESIDGEILKEYEKDNVYITEATLTNDALKLKRISKYEDGSTYYDIEDDQILTSAEGSNNDNLYKAVITEEMETTYQIVLAKELKTETIRVLTPREIIFEGNRNIIAADKESGDRYYSYAKGELTGIYTDVADAIVDASELFGVVVNKKMDYIWESGHRKTSTKIETISGSAMTEDQINAGITSVVICLEEMLEYKEVYKDVDTLFKESSVVTSVLKDNLPNMEVLDLSGCSLDDILYYVSRGYPVMAMTDENEAVLIVGYDSKNTILYSPLSGEVYKKGINDSKDYFDSFGNKYIGYIE